MTLVHRVSASATPRMLLFEAKAMPSRDTAAARQAFLTQENGIGGLILRG
jgi:hypothetical protein